MPYTHAYKHTKRMAKENSLNRKEIIMKLRTSKGKKNLKNMINIWINTTDFLSLDIYNLYLKYIYIYII